MLPGENYGIVRRAQIANLINLVEASLIKPRQGGVATLSPQSQLSLTISPNLEGCWQESAKTSWGGRPIWPAETKWGSIRLFFVFCFFVFRIVFVLYAVYVMCIARQEKTR